MISDNEYANLTSGDRILVNYKGRFRVSLVLCWWRGKLKVRLHKTSGSGWVRGEVTISKRDIDQVCRCSRLGINTTPRTHTVTRVERTPADAQLDLIGGAA